MIYCSTELQSISNLIGFLVAVIFSFFMNAKFTFNKKASPQKMISFTFFMGGVSYLMGLISDKLEFSAIFTLIAFSGVSLVLGFCYSRYVVFKSNK